MADQDDEKYLASAVKYLFELGKGETAKKLIGCHVASMYSTTQHFDEFTVEVWQITLRGSGTFYREFNTKGDRGDPSELYVDVREAFEAVVPEIDGDTSVNIIAKVGLVEVDTDWRTRLMAQAETQQVTNQNSYANTPLMWEGMRFNSKGEISIAEALERLGVMYLPNCLARVGTKDTRMARFPDFLICYRGKWGVLEVDGATYHTPTSATEDHERRRQFEQHGGIAFFDRFPYKRCLSEPDKVVKEFLDILGSK